ncbi:MAG: efflux RND transporter periplasmic adaptor subunit [Bacteroidota bacterium]|nr:efflux RND transporter periplasmic adaptor subunit [Bacteroidota bacterium]
MPESPKIEQAVNGSDLSSLRIHRGEPGISPKKALPRKKILLLSLAAVAACAVIAFLLLGGGVSSAETVETTEVSLASASQANAVLTASGYVVAQRKASVASKGTGRLEFLAVEEGDHVNKGSIIGRLESSDVEAVLGQAKAALEVARAGVAQAQAEYDDAQSNYERQKSLFTQKLISQADYDATNARYQKAIAGLVSAKASVAQAEAGVKAAEVNVENTYIRAPFDGVVLTKDANVGEVITPFGAASGSRGAVVTMADMSSLQVEADVSESYIEKIHTGQPCEITLDAVPDKQYKGVVHKIVPTADRAKATVLTKVEFLNRDERVLPEMSAKVLFLNKDAKQSDDALKISAPASAITTRGGKKVVFVLHGETVSMVPVTLGTLLGSSVEVKEGLSVGERVVLHPSEKLTNGSRVETAKQR